MQQGCCMRRRNRNRRNEGKLGMKNELKMPAHCAVVSEDEMTYVADPYNSPKAMEYISSAICSGLPLKEAVIVAEILNFRPDELEK